MKSKLFLCCTLLTLIPLYFSPIKAMIGAMPGTPPLKGGADSNIDKSPKRSQTELLAQQNPNQPPTATFLAAAAAYLNNYNDKFFLPPKAIGRTTPPDSPTGTSPMGGHRPPLSPLKGDVASDSDSDRCGVYYSPCFDSDSDSDIDVSDFKPVKLITLHNSGLQVPKATANSIVKYLRTFQKKNPLAFGDYVMWVLRLQPEYLVRPDTLFWLRKNNFHYNNLLEEEVLEAEKSKVHPVTEAIIKAAFLPIDGNRLNMRSPKTLILPERSQTELLQAQQTSIQPPKTVDVLTAAIAAVQPSSDQP